MALTKDQIEAVKKQADEQEKAIIAAGKEAAVLWKSRLDLAIASGDEEAVRGALGVTPAYLDTNTNCSGCTPRNR